MRFDSIRSWGEAHCGVFLDAVRIYLGIGLFVKGIYFATNNEHLMRILNDAGDLFIAHGTVAHYIIPIHIVGGLLLALGLLTRAAALVQIPILLGAMFYLYMPRMMLLEHRQNLEFSGLVLFLLVLISIFGSGRWSVDHWLSRRQPVGNLHPQPAT